MSNSRFSRWTRGDKRLGGGFSSFIKEALGDQPGSNPTGPGSIESPGQKARRLGLQGDGHGSYTDPQTGQIVARTINGELVFYDGGATGGVASDGEGGEGNLTQDNTAMTPTFTDPDTGMVKIPSAKPETPEDLAAVPDPVPATAPKDFGKFMQSRSDAIRAGEMSNPEPEAAAQDEVAPYEPQNQQQADLQAAQAEMGLEPQAVPQDQLDPVGHLQQPVTDDDGSTTTLSGFLDKQKKQTKTPITDRPAASGASSAGAGTVHEIAMLDALGGIMTDEDHNKLQQNLDISGANGQLALEIAKQNAADLKADFEAQGITIDNVIWTAQLRGDGLAKATGIPGLSDKNNQSDIIIRGTDAAGNPVQKGVSLKVATSKSTKYPGDIPFFNGGLGKESKRFGADHIEKDAKGKISDAWGELGLEAKTAGAAKKEIRQDPELKKKADEMGLEILKGIRNDLADSMAEKDVEEMRELLSTMTGAPTGDGQKLPTLKLTGYAHGNKKTKIQDALNGDVPMAIRNAEKFEFEPSGSSGIRIIADGVPVMKLRAKWESQALGSSIKFSGESP